MLKAVIGEEKLKGLLKEALTEIIDERRDAFYDLFVETLEDIGLANAIKEGASSGSASRQRINRLLGAACSSRG